MSQEAKLMSTYYSGSILILQEGSLLLPSEFATEKIAL